MAEQYLPYPANLELDCLRPAGQQLLVFRTKLRRIPAHNLPKLLRNSAGLFARHQSQDLALAVALDESHWYVEVQQTGECLTRHRARKHIASDHYLVYPSSPNILEDCFKRWEVPMDIVDRGDLTNYQSHTPVQVSPWTDT
jgi:hypothetical protein